jgi:hypothetical protein
MHSSHLITTRVGFSNVFLGLGAVPVGLPEMRKLLFAQQAIRSIVP